MMVSECLGHSDREIIVLEILSVMRKKDSRVAMLDFRGVNLKLFSKLLGRVAWKSAFEGLGAHKCWSVFKKQLLEAQEQANRL